MSEKNFKLRVKNKHDTEANWKLATNFKPLVGEIIIYDADNTYSTARIKIGDGVTVVNDLPFSAYAPEQLIEIGESGQTSPSEGLIEGGLFFKKL